MTIINSDGTPFKLRGPNPIVNQQADWTGKVVLHNFQYEDEITVEKKPEKKASDGIPKNLFHCLPASIKEYTDEFYGDKKTGLVYLPAFTFEGIVIKTLDVSFSVWTNSAKISHYSVVFSPEQRRWWKVNDSEEKAGGMIYHCIPSDYQPSFEMLTVTKFG